MSAECYRARKSPPVAVLFLLLASSAAAVPYTYTTYEQMVTELEALELAYPELVEVFTGQDAYSLPSVLDGATELDHYIVRITNEATGFGKPEVLLVGVQHGNEIVSVEVLLALAEFLVESYGQNAWLTELVNRREIFLMPLLNPWGHRQSPQLRWAPKIGGGTEDMNRDHPYDPGCLGSCSNPTLSTIGAQAVHELARRHLFRVMLDYHGGVEMILHPWGSPAHASPDDTSPDHTALDALGQRMSLYGGPYSDAPGGGYLPVFTANDGLGPATGPLDDTGYATSWDFEQGLGVSDPAYFTEGWRALSYTIEISQDKTPPASTLGGDADLLSPGGLEDGYVPKHVRVGLAAIDIAEPYVVWTNRDSLPTVVKPKQTLLVEWQVRGCFEVDETRVRWGTDPDPLASFDGETPTQSQSTGDPCFEPPMLFQETLSLDTEGEYWVVPTARVDQALLQQSDPNPVLPAQSFVVRSRTEDGLMLSESVDASEINVVIGQLDWGAEPKRVLVDAGLLFADGFGTGDTSAWSSSLP